MESIITQIAVGVVPVVFGVVTSIFANKYKAVKNVLDKFDAALEDDELSPKEIKKIWKAIKGVVS